ncbi:MAG: co-chaperone GroES [Patescibacteria group bacterium]
MTLRPLGDRLIVEPAKGDEVTKSGIIIPDAVNREKPEQGKVIAVGVGKLSDNGTRIPMDVKVGDTVVFKKYAPDEVTIDEKEYFVLSESDIMAVIE